MEMLIDSAYYWSTSQLNAVGLQGLIQIIVISGISIFKFDLGNLFSRPDKEE